MTDKTRDQLWADTYTAEKAAGRFASNPAHEADMAVKAYDARLHAQVAALTAAPADTNIASGAVTQRVIEAARRVADDSTDLGEDFHVPSHAMAPLSLALDEYDAALASASAQPVAAPLKTERWNPLKGGNPETALQMAAVIAHRDAQPVAEPAKGAVYAPLPGPIGVAHIHESGELISAHSIRFHVAHNGEGDFDDHDTKIYTADDMRAFADATHTLRAESLAAAYREELDKLSQRNYELRLPSHGQALRLLTQDERDSLGRRAEGMDGNEWDQWVQEKFAQVNGLKVQGGSYEWDWE